MAVDGTTSPVHQHTEARTVKSESRDSYSPDEAMVPGDNEINVDIKPNISPIAECDERHQMVRMKLPAMSSLPAENGSYYFGESHVTRLESFVESMTGPSFPPHPSSRLDTHWSSSVEKPGGTSATSRKPASTSCSVSSISSNHNQPLDLSVKPSSQTRQTLNESPVSFRRAENRMKTSDMSSDIATAAMAAASAVAGFPASAYPTLADMWLAHWLNMATVASNMFPHLPLNLPANHHLMSTLSPSLGIQTNILQHHVSPDRRLASPYLQSSMMESPKSSSTSSLLSCPTPVKAGSVVSPTACLQDGAVNTSSSHSDRRRRHAATSDVTSSQQSASAFSMFHRSGDRRDSTVADGGRRRGNTVAALSAIESFVENSFSRDNKKNGSAALLSSATKRYDKPSSMSTAIKRCRRLGDDHMTSSGDEETGSCDGAERARGFGGKRRRQQQHRKPESAHQRHLGGENDFETKLTGSGFLSLRQPSVSVDTASSSVDYLPCLTYDRPANTKHPLECLERLVHVQSNARRSAHVRQASVTSPSSPSSTSHGRSQNEAVTPFSGGTDDRTETVDGGDSNVTCSSSVDDVAETTRKVDDVTTTLPVDTFRNPTTASLVSCNM